jgi:hypothetical protein
MGTLPHWRRLSASKRKLELGYFWMKLTRVESAAQRGQDERQNLE